VLVIFLLAAQRLVPAKSVVGGPRNPSRLVPVAYVLGWNRGIGGERNVAAGYSL